MSRRINVILAILTLALIFLGAGLVWAERTFTESSYSNESVDLKSGLESNTLSFSLGDPGTSYGYLETFGTTEEPYLEDYSHFMAPYGVGTEGATLWIADSDGHRSLTFSDDGSFLSQIGKGGIPYAIEGTFLDWITDVVIDSQGYIWLADGTADHVAEVNSAGELMSDLGTLGEAGNDNDHFDSPRGMAFDSAGNVYISDNNNHRIQVFDSSGVYTTTIGVGGESGSDNEHFFFPRHISIYSDTLYVADAGNHRVQIIDVSDIFSPTHEATIGTTGVSSDTNGYLNWPMGVAVNESYIYVVEFFNHRVQVFDRDSLNYLDKFGSETPSSGDGDFAWPTDVAVDSAGNIYVADPTNLRVQQFDTSLNHIRSHGTPGVPFLTDEMHYFQPTGVAVSDDGSIHIVERMSKRLVKLDSYGQPQWSVGSAVGIGGGGNDNFRDPEDVSVNSLGQVYVADTDNHRIQVYDVDGSYLDTIGSFGDGNYQFDRPFGMAVDSNDYLYVADKNNARVQIFDNTHNFVATMAVTPTLPVDVAVSEAGDIYVVDQELHRVQKYDSNLTFVLTIGETGIAGEDHGHLSSPTAVTVDSNGRVLVADDLGGRIQVFDDNGAYLTTLGGAWGSISGQMREVAGLATDANNNLFIADQSSHHIRVYTLGIPGWNQLNINGFGYADSGIVTALSGYQQALYSGLFNTNSGGQLFRLDSSDTWEEININGFGDLNNVAIADLSEFNDQLYAGTLNDVAGGQIWRSSSGDLGSWELVASGGFTSANNSEVVHLAVYSQTLYAATYNTADGGEIWRSNSGNDGSWGVVVTDGFTSTYNLATVSLVHYGNHLYAATVNEEEGSQVWRSQSGDAGTWEKVSENGLGDSYNTQITLEVFDGLLYAGTENNAMSDNPGAELWSCQLCDGSDWNHHDAIKGFGSATNLGISSLISAEDSLYALTHNKSTGIEVWRSRDVVDWVQIGSAGFGDSNNTTTNWDNSALIYGGELVVGTENLAQGGEIWASHKRIFIPFITK